MRRWRVAAGQLASTDDKQHNLEQARRLVAEAAEAGARLVVLPEATMMTFAVPLALPQVPNFMSVGGLLGSAGQILAGLGLLVVVASLLPLTAAGRSGAGG